jgi:hypothetical protein
MKTSFIRFVISGLALSILAPAVFAESRSERKARENAESAQAVNVDGGATITVELAPADAFPAVVSFLQKAGSSIETANKDAGSIVTTLSIKGSYRQTGTRTQITVIDEGSGKTSLRVAISTQKRYNGLQVEPWSTAKLDTDESQKLATALQAALTKK